MALERLILFLRLRTYGGYTLGEPADKDSDEAKVLAMQRRLRASTELGLCDIPILYMTY